MEILVGESVFLYVWCGNAVASQQPYLDESSAHHEIRCYFIDQYSAVSNNFVSTSSISKLSYRDIAAFRTKIECMRIWSLTHCKFTFPNIV